MDVLQFIRQMQEMYGDELIKPASELPRPQQALDREMFVDFNKRNKFAGGQLVKPSADGSRPGYAATKTSTIKSKKLNKHKDKLIEQYNKIVLKDFAKEDLSKTKTWKQFLENKDLKGGSIGFYENMNREGIKVIYPRTKRGELANMLIERANNDLKHTEWMDIQKKVSPQKRIDLKWKDYIVRLDKKADKVNKAFTYLFDNEIKLKKPKNLTGSDVYERSIFRNVISDLTGVKSNKVIRAGLNDNDAFIKNKNLINFASTGGLFTEREGNTLREILDTAEYRMGGNISFSSDITRSTRANKNVFDYALRNFNHHQKYKTRRGTITFYDAKTNKPIIWNDVPLNENGFKSLKPSDVYFIDSTQQGPKTKWTLSTIDADNEKWSKGKKTSRLFDEVFQAKDTYDKLLDTEVTDPLNPKGKKITFKKLMEEVYQTGFDNFGNPYSIEHGSGVSEKPFKNLGIASQRVNSALYHLERNTSLSTKELNAVRKELNKGVFPTQVKNTDLKIRRIIDSTQQLQKDVLVKGKKFNQTELQTQLAKLSTNPRCRFSGGGSADLAFCANEGRNRLEKIIIKGGATGEEGDLAKKILQAGRGLKSALSLRGLLGPAAAAFLLAEEGGYVGYDMFAKGKTFKEAVGDSYFNLALGDRSKIDPTKERDKRLREIGGGPPSQAFRAMSEKEMGELAAYENVLKEDQKINQAFFDDMNAKQKLEQAKKFSPAVVDKRQKTYDETRANIRDILKPASVLPLLSVDYDAGKRALEKARGLTTRDQLTSTGPKTFGKIFPPAERSRQSDLEEAEAQILGQDLATLKANPAFKFGMKEKIMFPSSIDASIFADGGRAGLSGGDTSGPPPEKGPMSQGLLSLYKNGRKL